MNAFEIAGGILLVISCIVIIAVVMMQESKSRGMGAISGGDSAMNMTKGRAKTKDALLSRVAKIGAIVFFSVSLAVCIFSVYLK